MLYFVFHFFEQFLRSRNQHHLTVHAMFGLRKKVGCYESRISGFVGNDFHFRRTCRHVDGYIVQRHLLLGSHDVLIARAEYLVHLGDTLRAVCHGTDGLHATCLENLAHSCHLSRIENGRMNLSFLVGRGTKHDFLATGNLGRNSQHQHGRKQGCRTSGDIQTYLLDTYRLLPACHAFHGFHLLSLELLFLMESIDVPLSQEDSHLQFDGHLCFCLLQFFRSYGQGFQLHMVELFFVFDNGLIAIRFDIFQNHADLFRKCGHV